MLHRCRNCLAPLRLWLRRRLDFGWSVRFLLLAVVLNVLPLCSDRFDVYFAMGHADKVWQSHIAPQPRVTLLTTADVVFLVRPLQGGGRLCC